MRRVFLILAVLLGFVSITVPADGADNAVRVNRATFHSYVQDSLSPCGTGWQDPTQNRYVPPVPPQSVKDAVANDQADSRDWYNKYRDFVNITPGGHRTGNGLPINVWRAQNYDIRYLHVNGMDIQVRHNEYRYHAWVPNFRGSGCDVWTELEYVD